MAGEEPVDLLVDEVHGVLRCVLPEQDGGLQSLGAGHEEGRFGLRVQVRVHVAEVLALAKQ